MVHGTNTVKWIKDEYVFFDAWSAYVPSPLFSEARMLPEQLSKSCRLCASLETALDAVLAALRGPSVDGTEKQEFGNFGLPLLLSFGLLSPSPPPNVVSLFDELVLPFLSSFRSMLSFFHSLLAFFSPNMPSLVFPALHSLSHLHATARCCAWGSGDVLGNAVADELSAVLV
ncbi:hypothetical protein BLNAU_5849 [Blattamonas nauphoetae]|uniref:Uncharacterized protein n=1 Tax=Blattamonas nauphoetae TaxID=2049346 RepID=A0ABQ9WY15_9EUKA|nr:hypothetical protein BLNAU_23840 [Blattamonas nauphoetae]KAK2944334.1 hypothetical protein BLNAU_20728 [Blattamonas nauphoetae]KAK2944355.1 hypothetical protein BLNAU_20749 [Blattamonas nauphoetae]KAK2957846.1 hypothetical protein BLNAU_7280 [Blattamonas nauphoetae]KAK2959291.1 hypothetical protein BLNAU_5849 [Blattamonas nauphoetae]